MPSMGKRDRGHHASVAYMYDRREPSSGRYVALCSCGWVDGFADAPIFPDHRAQATATAAAQSHDPSADTEVYFPLDDPTRTADQTAWKVLDALDVDEVPLLGRIPRRTRVVVALACIALALLLRVLLGHSSWCSTPGVRWTGLYEGMLAVAACLLATLIRPRKHRSYQGMASTVRLVGVLGSVALIVVSVVNLTGTPLGSGKTTCSASAVSALRVP